MLQVGISIGSNKNLKAIVSHLPKMLLIPLGTIIRYAVILRPGKFAIASMERVRLYGSGKWICLLFTLFHPYHPVQEPSIGLQLATELGTIALLTNIFREMMTLLGTPIIKKYLKLAPISAAGVN